METIVFHMTVNATAIGTLRKHREVYRRDNKRKKRAFADAQRTYIRKRIEYWETLTGLKYPFL